MTEEKPEIRNLTAMSMKDLERELAVANEKLRNQDDASAEVLAVMREAKEKIRQQSEQLVQLKTEIEAARKTADGAMAREKAAEKLRAETNVELTTTIKELADATTFRDRYKEERDGLRESMKLAVAKIKDLEKKP